MEYLLYILYGILANLIVIFVLLSIKELDLLKEKRKKIRNFIEEKNDTLIVLYMFLFIALFFYIGIIIGEKI